MTAVSVFAVGIGAALGAWLRWLLGAALNVLMPTLPLGTLAVNLGGGFLIGIALAWFAAHGELHPAWRLFVVTGFLGGLTTFSTFSAESLILLQRGEWLAAALHSAAHLFGALALCALGYRLVVVSA